ncbi:exosome non-catalytic core subunit rrp40 [Ascosphaera aggregata]|nr:exosome non-catalytic core subunit rrp40 [Ascosphaera aggregata]
MSETILLPGDYIPHPEVKKSTVPLKLTPGLRLLQDERTNLQKPKAVITTTQTGLLTTSSNRHRTTIAISTFPRRRYLPAPNDLVIAQIHHSSVDYFHCILAPNSQQAYLGQLAFEGATKKTRPMLRPTESVYARVLAVGIGEVELTCVNPATGKAEPDGLGPLNGGTIFDVSVGFASRLMMGSGSDKSGVVILEELGKKLESHGGFEIAVGKNGKVWVNCSGAGAEAVRATIAIGRCLADTDEKNLAVAEQRKLVTRILKEMSDSGNQLHSGDLHIHRRSLDAMWPGEAVTVHAEGNLPQDKVSDNSWMFLALAVNRPQHTNSVSIRNYANISAFYMLKVLGKTLTVHLI